jgi:hypothetical protein
MRKITLMEKKGICMAEQQPTIAEILDEVRWLFDKEII